VGGAVNRTQTSKERYLILARLLDVWNELPFLRLGQLISNSCSQDLFDVSDDQLIESIEKTLRESL
jgi:hypothetical protein